LAEGPFPGGHQEKRRSREQKQKWEERGAVGRNGKMFWPSTPPSLTRKSALKGGGDLRFEGISGVGIEILSDYLSRRRTVHNPTGQTFACIRDGPRRQAAMRGGKKGRIPFSSNADRKDKPHLKRDFSWSWFGRGIWPCSTRKRRAPCGREKPDIVHIAGTAGGAAAGARVPIMKNAQLGGYE